MPSELVKQSPIQARPEQAQHQVGGDRDVLYAGGDQAIPDAKQRQRTHQREEHASGEEPCGGLFDAAKEVGGGKALQKAERNNNRPQSLINRLNPHTFFL